MKQIVDFDFGIKERVLLKDIQQGGMIDSLLFDNDGAQYRIVYWVNGERKQTWVYAWEIEAVRA